MTQDFATQGKFKFNNSREGFEMALERAKMDMVRTGCREEKGLGSAHRCGSEPKNAGPLAKPYSMLLPRKSYNSTVREQGFGP